MTDNKEKLKEKTDEISDEIESSLKDPKGILSHQKRLAFCLSLGITQILEDYLNKNNVFKKCYKINHQWLKKSKDNLKLILADKVTSSLDKLPKIDKIIDVAYEIESKRNELAYGAKVSEELLKDLINKYLEIKKEVENG